MLHSTDITLTFPESVRINGAMGSVLHGALMEQLDKETAARWHSMSLRPYSQVLYWDKKQQSAIWRIGTLTEEAYTKIIGCLQSLSRLTLKHEGYAVKIQQIRTQRETSFAELAANFIQAEQAPKGAEWRSLSVMSFKQNNRYVILPDARLMYQSLLNRWNMFSPDIKLEADDLAGKLAAHCLLKKYDLHSQIFSVEGTAIYGCYGIQQYRFFGYDMIKRLQGLLASFAEFSGVGVKTALGMGAVQTQLYK